MSIINEKLDDDYQYNEFVNQTREKLKRYEKRLGLKHCLTLKRATGIEYDIKYYQNKVQDLQDEKEYLQQKIKNLKDILDPPLDIIAGTE